MGAHTATISPIDLVVVVIHDGDGKGARGAECDGVGREGWDGAWRFNDCGDGWGFRGEERVL